jgi:hypothetical protein
MSSPAIPLTPWADAELAALAQATGSAAIAALDGATLLGERAALNGFAIPGRMSAGGGCHLLETRDGCIALNLARADDVELLPALFGTADVGETTIERFTREHSAATLVATGRELGLAIAALDGEPAGPAIDIVTEGPVREATQRPPLVVDLSALWAGPLAGHLLQLAGATVLKVESCSRPDAMRDGDPALFARVNQSKASLLVDLRAPEGIAALTALIARADIVIEAARPRALRQLGIDAEALVRATPGLVWLTITGHGGSGEAANWVGFGDDVGVAAGLSAALRDASGTIGFVGDAIADPLTGIAAARAGWERWRSGRGGRIMVSMRGVAAKALAAERARDPAELDVALKTWAQAAGQPFPAPPIRAAGDVRLLGADSEAWLRC